MSKTINLDLPEKYWEPLRVVGVSRDVENPKALSLYLSRGYSDKEMRDLQDTMRENLGENGEPIMGRNAMRGSNPAVGIVVSPKDDDVSSPFASPAPSQHTGWSDEAVEAELDIHVTGVNILGEYNIAMRFKGEQFFEGFSLGRNDAMKRSQRDFLERATQHYPLITGRLVDAAPVCPKCSKTCREDAVSLCCDDCGMCWPKTADWDTRIDTPTSCGYCFGSGRRMSGGVCPDCAGTGLAASSIAPARMPHSGAKVSDIVAMIDADTIAPATGFEVKALIDYLWQEFCELPDRSSPEEYPDMALVNLAELTAIVETYADRRIRSSISPSAAKGGEDRHVDIAHDGFSGDVIGSYVTREGKRGFVVQQDGTRVVHVYGEKFAGISPSVAKESGEP